jgi:hypothetical protein
MRRLRLQETQGKRHLSVMVGMTPGLDTAWGSLKAGLFAMKMVVPLVLSSQSV